MKKNFSFANFDVVNLAKKFGTPFFLFDEAKVEENYNLLKNSFSFRYKNVRIDYSAKTNCELGVLKIVKKVGGNLEISSIHELEVAKRAGFAPSDMILDTPVKKEEEIIYMLNEGIHAFYLDSLDDLAHVRSAAAKKRKKVKVVLRVSPPFPWAFLDPAERFLKKFGMQKEEVYQAAEELIEDPNLYLIGLSVHVGSQKLNPKMHLESLELIFSLAKDLEKKGFILEELCLGGGYPSQTLSKKTFLGLALSLVGLSLKQKVAPVSEFGQKISEAFARKAKKLSSKPILVIQPGRSLVSNSGIAVGSVMAHKGNWIFIDLSCNSLPESLFFGQRKLFLANKYLQPPVGKFHVAGRGLNTADNLSIYCPLPDPSVGDVAVILDAGAYSISRANRFTTLNPPVFMASRGKLKKIRRKETYEDILAPMES